MEKKRFLSLSLSMGTKKRVQGRVFFKGEALFGVPHSFTRDIYKTHLHFSLRSFLLLLNTHTHTANASFVINGVFNYNSSISSSSSSNRSSSMVQGASWDDTYRFGRHQFAPNHGYPWPRPVFPWHQCGQKGEPLVQTL